MLLFFSTVVNCSGPLFCAFAKPKCKYVRMSFGLIKKALRNFQAEALSSEHVEIQMMLGLEWPMLVIPPTGALFAVAED